MAIVVTLVGLLLTLAGIVLAVAPQRLLDWIRGMESRTRFGVAIGARAVMGVLFLLAAPACRQPLVVQIVGWIALVAAVGILLMGRNRLDRFLAWWLERPLGFLRGWSVVAMGFGVLLLYSGA